MRVLMNHPPDTGKKNPNAAEAPMERHTYRDRATEPAPRDRDR